MKRLSSGVSGSTRIYNPVSGAMFTIKELHDQKLLPTVATLMGPITCDLITWRGNTELTEITTITGRRLLVTSTTCVLCSNRWEYVSNLEPYEYIGVGSNYLLTNVVWEQIATLVRTVQEDCYDLTIPIAGHYSANWIWVTGR